METDGSNPKPASSILRQLSGSRQAIISARILSTLTAARAHVPAGLTHGTKPSKTLTAGTVDTTHGATANRRQSSFRPRHPTNPLILGASDRRAQRQSITNSVVVPDPLAVPVADTKTRLTFLGAPINSVTIRFAATGNFAG